MSTQYEKEIAAFWGGVQNQRRLANNCRYLAAEYPNREVDFRFDEHAHYKKARGYIRKIRQHRARIAQMEPAE